MEITTVQFGSDFTIILKVAVNSTGVWGFPVVVGTTAPVVDIDEVDGDVPLCPAVVVPLEIPPVVVGGITVPLQKDSSVRLGHGTPPLESDFRVIRILDWIPPTQGDQASQSDMTQLIGIKAMTWTSAKESRRLGPGAVMTIVLSLNPAGRVAFVKNMEFILGYHVPFPFLGITAVKFLFNNTVSLESNRWRVNG